MFKCFSCNLESSFILEVLRLNSKMVMKINLDNDVDVTKEYCKDCMMPFLVFN